MFRFTPSTGTTRLRGPRAFRQVEEEFDKWHQETIDAQVDHLNNENDRLHFALWEISKIGEVLSGILALISSRGHGDLSSSSPSAKSGSSAKTLGEVNERMKNMEDCVAKEIEEMNRLLEGWTPEEIVSENGA